MNIQVSKSLFSRLIGLAEDLKEIAVNACEDFEDDEHISEEELEEWKSLLAEANKALGEQQ